MSLSLSLVACGDDDDDATDGNRGGDDAGAVATACDRVEALGDAILEVPETASVADVEGAVRPALDAFMEAAEESGDDRLAELATTASDAFSIYVTGDGIDAREAGNDVDIALDRTAERCIELGATNDFPEEPDP
ncbi:MAG: hypothetical protein ACRD2C_00900 [Acidimicrobiales bacterium]